MTAVLENSRNCESVALRKGGVVANQVHALRHLDAAKILYRVPLNKFPNISLHREPYVKSLDANVIKQ